MLQYNNIFNLFVWPCPSLRNVKNQLCSTSCAIPPLIWLINEPIKRSADILCGVLVLNNLATKYLCNCLQTINKFINKVDSYLSEFTACLVYVRVFESQKTWKGFCSYGGGWALHLCLLVSKLVTLKQVIKC